MVWLGDGDVATLRPSGSSVAVYYVHTDQLNTPGALVVGGLLFFVPAFFTARASERIRQSMVRKESKPDSRGNLLPR